MDSCQITQWCARFIREQVKPGDLCIDATMGNGNDTLLLSTLCKENGQVLAFDIQEMALTNTRKRLQCAGAPENYQLILDSHTNMGSYASPGSVSCIVFNLGYLPGGDHSLSTKAETSIQALEQGLSLLQKNGLISLCIYSGGDTGFEEKDAILEYLRSLPARDYTVIQNTYFNRGNNPPMPVFIFKE